MKIGFDNALYLKEQTDYILKTAKRYDNKLYLECGGKLLHDMHAARILPGYDSCVKMKVFASIIDKIDIIICISSLDIVNKKVRADFGRTYADDVLRMIADFKQYGLNPKSVVITRFSGEKESIKYKEMLERHGIKVYLHYPIEDYPFNLDKIVSSDGYGKNEYVETTKPVVIVTAPGPGSGKLATALSQVYHSYKNGIKAGYAKFETFPIWNLDINHPVNIAYESATADLADVNQLDYYYLESTGKIATNYNRDMEAFPVVKSILEKITGKAEYSSPTEMGVNRCGFAICDDEVCKKAARQEIIRRYLNAKVDFLNGVCTEKTLERTRDIMVRAGLDVNDRPCVKKCLEALELKKSQGKGKGSVTCVATLELENGQIITGTNSPLMHAGTALVFNAIKTLAGIDDKIDLIPRNILDSVLYMKSDVLKEAGESLNVSEALVCLSVAAKTDANAKKAVEKLPFLRGLECHMSHVPPISDASAFRKLGINLTSEALFAN